jgi:hypothetical protein
MNQHTAIGLILAACALVAGAASAALPLKTIEECIETGTRAVSLPGAAGGSISAAPCAGCAAMNLRFDARTVYLVGKQAVNYAKFRQVAVKSDLQLDVFYEPKTRTVTRLRIPAVAPVK